jgi:3-hydroxyacyl-[acyl-carrier-protein] dehydratase
MSGSASANGELEGKVGVEGGLDDLVGLLPHRPPFRFVDAVDEIVRGERIVARYQVTGDEDFLAGHFPGRPIFPGVIQLEALAQAGAIAVLADERYAGKLPLFGGVEEVRFRRQVVPGDEMVLTVDLDRLSSRGGWGRATATVGGKTTCSGRLFFVLAPNT